MIVVDPLFDTTPGLREAWIQRPGTRQQHYDLTAGKRAQALAQGAIEVPRDWEPPYARPDGLEAAQQPPRPPARGKSRPSPACRRQFVRLDLRAALSGVTVVPDRPDPDGDGYRGGEVS